MPHKKTIKLVWNYQLTTAALIGDVWPLKTLLTFPVLESYALAVQSPEPVITEIVHMSLVYGKVLDMPGNSVAREGMRGGWGWVDAMGKSLASVSLEPHRTLVSLAACSPLPPLKEMNLASPMMRGRHIGTNV